MRAAECFAGCGGTTCGLIAAGLDVRLGIDNDAAALAVLRANHAHATLQMDLGDVEGAVQAIREVGHVDLLSGSPPCCDFSSAGSRREREGVAGLIVAFARLAATLGPRCLWIENVPEVLRSNAWADSSELLAAAGYSVVVLRVNSAACGCAQVRRRIFVLATRGCDEAALRRVEHEAASYSKTPANAPKVRDCLDDPNVRDCYWYNARNRHSPCVRSTDLPAPTLRCNCLAPPSCHYQARHDDAGDVSNAHVLSVSEMARIASFPSNYFDGVSRTAAGRMIGNCVCPCVAQQVAQWCLELLQAPVSAVHRPIHRVAMRRRAQRVSRLHKLVDSGLLDARAVLTGDGTLIYLGGSSRRGDEIVRRVLGWTPEPAWKVKLVPRRNLSAGGGQAPLDDLYIHVPGVAQPFRSIRQLLRSSKHVRITQQDFPALTTRIDNIHNSH